MKHILGLQSLMHLTPWFGEWLSRPVTCRGIRLVIEQMSERADRTGVAALHIETDPPSRAPQPREFGSNGCLGFEFAEDRRVTSFRYEPFSDTAWVRRARVEIRDAATGHWRVVAPSRLIDAYHRQPCVFESQIERFESRFLPAGCGTTWTNDYYHDLLVRTLEPCGPGSRFPDWLTARTILGAAAWPTGFHGAFNAGDCGCFDALIATIFQPAFMIESNKLFPDWIGRFGFMPGVMNAGKTTDAFTLDYSSIIWGPSCYWDLWSWSRDREFLRWFTDSLARWSRWYLAHRDRNGDGWLEPGVNSCREATAEQEARLRRRFATAGWPEEGFRYVGTHHPECSALLLSIFECPWDDGPVYVRGRCRGIRFDPEICSVNIHFIETQLYNAGLADFCARAFAELGDAGQAAEFHRQARRLEALVRDHCWDEWTGFYYDRDVATARLRTDCMSAGGFYPMIHGLPTMQQARRMVSHLLDPEKFWTAYPVPTVPRDDPDYDPTHYWSGRSWPPVNFHILRGLIRYGFFDAADQLLSRWAAQIRSCYERPPREQRRLLDYTDPSLNGADMRGLHIPDCEVISPENWNSETGAVIGSPGLTWGGLWIPAILYRNFWPDGEHHVRLRPGGYLRFCHKQWDVTVDGNRAEVNGHRVEMSEQSTYRLDCRTGEAALVAVNQDVQ